MSWGISLWALASKAAWEVATVWQALVCIGLLAAIWSTLRAVSRGGENGPVRSNARGRAGLPGMGEWFSLAAVTGLGLALRLHGRGALPYWWDELLAVWMAQADLPTLLRSLFTPSAPASDFTPPLFYLLLHGWTALFGAEEGQARVLTILFSTAQIPLLGLLGRRLLSRRAGLAAAFLLAISPPSIFYAQQIRCYALLGMLAIASALCVARAFEIGRPRDMVLLGIVGTLFLYTHYVASWVWLGMGAATLIAVGSAWIPDSVASRAATFGRAASVPAGFCLAALCPFFDPPLLKDTRSLWYVVAAFLLVIGMLPIRPIDSPRGRDVRSLTFLAAAFVAPVLLLCLWMLPSGVLTVIGGAGSRIPGSYGFAEFAGMLRDFTGPQDVLDATMQGLGLFLVLSGLYCILASKPRQALFLLGWGALPMAMAMAVQNPSMNLVRYLSVVQPAVSLCVATALCEACNGLALAIPGGWRTRLGRIPLVDLAAPVILGACLLGYGAYTATNFPTLRANIENYPAAAKRLCGMNDFFLAGQSQNLIRALSWYMERQGCSSVEFGTDSPKLAAANVFLDGRFWHANSVSNLGLSGAKSLGGQFGEIALFERASSMSRCLPILPDDGGMFTLKGDVLRDCAIRGRNVAFAGGNAEGLVPFFKKRPGRVVYRFWHGRVEQGFLNVNIEGVVTGPKSFIEVRVRDVSKRILAAASLRGGELHAIIPANGEVGKNGLSATILEPLASGQAEVEILLDDDASGVIYSSNVILRKVTLSFSSHGK